jgi:hypothetical protein
LPPPQLAKAPQLVLFRTNGLQPDLLELYSANDPIGARGRHPTALTFRPGYAGAGRSPIGLGRGPWGAREKERREAAKLARYSLEKWPERRRAIRYACWRTRFVSASPHEGQTKTCNSGTVPKLGTLRISFITWPQPAQTTKGRLSGKAAISAIEAFRAATCCIGWMKPSLTTLVRSMR